MPEQYKFPSWQAPLLEVILEQDRESLDKKIEGVETLIAKRLEELRPVCKKNMKERAALTRGLYTLRILKTEGQNSSLATIDDTPCEEQSAEQRARA